MSQQATKLDREHPIYKSLAEVIRNMTQVIETVPPDIASEAHMESVRELSKGMCCTIAIGLAMDFGDFEMLPLILEDFGFDEAVQNDTAEKVANIVLKMKAQDA